MRNLTSRWSGKSVRRKVIENIYYPAGIGSETVIMFQS